WGSLRDSVQSGGQRRGDDLQGHPERHAGDAIQLLLRKRVHGRRAPRSGARPGHQRRLLRDNKRWRVGLWDGLRNHTGRHADDAAPLLFPKRVRGRLKPLRGAGPDRQWGLLRDSKEWRGQRRWDGLRNHPEWRADDTVHVLFPSGCTDGSNPLAGLVEATNGDLYGTTNGGGASDLGTVFKITPSGTLTTLHSFDRTDGSARGTILVQGTDGNFYRTTYGGGAHGDGTIFEMAASGTLATLHSFCRHGGACTGGRNPEAGLLQATNGTFY